jgi:hypothetical protein
MGCYVKDRVRRARRLLRFYPRSWRDRYGEEFCAVVERQIEELPHSPKRTFDVARAGARVRIERAGLVGPVQLGDDRPPIGLASTLVGIVVFSLAALDVYWSYAQLAPPRVHPIIPPPGWYQPMIPATGTLRITLVTAGLTGALLACLAAWTVVRAALDVWSSGRWERMRRPVALTAGAVLVLVLALVALSIAYPGNRYPFNGGSSIAWSAISPGTWYTLINRGIGPLFPYVPARPLVLAWPPLFVLLLAGATIGTIVTVRRLRFSASSLSFLARLSQLATLAMVGVLVAFWWWWSSFAGLNGGIAVVEVDGWVPIGLMLVSFLITAQGSFRAAHRYRHTVIS